VITQQSKQACLTKILHRNRLIMPRMKQKSNCSAEWDDFALEYEKRVEPFTAQFAQEMIRPFVAVLERDPNADAPGRTRTSSSSSSTSTAPRSGSRTCSSSSSSGDASRMMNGGGSRSVLDLGCGVGAVSLSLLAMSRADHRFGTSSTCTVVATDASKSMAERTRQRIFEVYGKDAPFSALTADGQHLPDEWTNRFDIVLSNFAVIFFHSPFRGLTEMIRCLTPSTGVAAFTAWGSIDETPAFRVFPDVASELVPHLVAARKPKRITGSAAVLTSLMKQAGFVDVRVVGPITKTLEVGSAMDFYDRFALTSPPTAEMIDKMSDEMRKRFKDRVVEVARERGGRPDGSAALNSSAYIAYGRKP